jgi:DNA-binding transcriptional ArsR family regulator
MTKMIEKDPEAAWMRARLHPLRWRVMVNLMAGEHSPSDMAEAFGEPIGNVSYHTRILARLGLIELTKTKQVRGAVEHYYRAAYRPPEAPAEQAITQICDVLEGPGKVREKLDRITAIVEDARAEWAKAVDRRSNGSGS